MTELLSFPKKILRMCNGFKILKFAMPVLFTVFKVLNSAILSPTSFSAHLSARRGKQKRKKFFFNSFMTETVII